MDAKHVSALFAEANPVPDVEGVRRELEPSVVDLATLESRSRVMATNHLTHLMPAPPKRRLQPALTFAVALIVVVAAIGGVALLMRGDTAPVVDEPTTTAAQSVTTEAPVTTIATPATTVAEPAPPPPTVPQLDEGWDVATLGPQETTWTAVEYVDGIGWLAMGGSSVMLSTNGADWMESDGGATLNDDAAYITGIVPGGPGVLAYGWTCEGERCPVDQGPALYGSADGLAWERITSDAFRGCGQLTADCFSGIQSMAAGPDGSLIASGVDTGESVIWTSADGQNWERQSIDLMSLVPEGSMLMDENVTGLTALGDRWLGFVNTYSWPDDAEFEQGRAILIESTDGIEWSIVDTGQAFAEAVPWHVTAGPGGIVAIDGSHIWHSADGSGWTVTEVSDIGDADLLHPVALPSGFVVAGGSMEGPGVVLVSSNDGTDWSTFSSIERLDYAVFHGFAARETADGIEMVGVGAQFGEGDWTEQEYIPSAIFHRPAG
jgi:hypothetical protein